MPCTYGDAFYVVKVDAVYAELLVQFFRIGNRQLGLEFLAVYRGAMVHSA